MEVAPDAAMNKQAVSSMARAGTKPLPRYQQRGEAAPAVVLQPRDLQLLEDTWRYGFLTTTQLEVLRGSDPEPQLRFVSRLTLTRRLKLLYHNRYLQRIARPLSQGSLEPVYALDREGARALSRKYGEAAPRPPTQLLKGAALDHRLGIAQVRVSLVAACRVRGSIELLNWQSGGTVKFRAEVNEAGERRHKATLFPDAFFSLQVTPRRLFYFLVADQGLEPARTLALQCRAYYGYWHSGGFGRDFSLPAAVGFRVLMVAPTPQRQATILQAVATLEAGRTIFWASSEQRINPQEILLPIWQDGSTQERKSLVG